MIGQVVSEVLHPPPLHAHHCARLLLPGLPRASAPLPLREEAVHLAVFDLDEQLSAGVEEEGAAPGVAWHVQGSVHRELPIQSGGVKL